MEQEIVNEIAEKEAQTPPFRVGETVTFVYGGEGDAMVLEVKIGSFQGENFYQYRVETGKDDTVSEQWIPQGSLKRKFNYHETRIL